MRRTRGLTLSSPLAASVVAIMATGTTSGWHLPPALVMLDRDGVINHDVGSPGVVRGDQFRLTPGAARAIGSLKRSGCNVVVVTNQSCVGKGLLSSAGLTEIHDEMERKLLEHDGDAVIDKIYCCTSAGEDPRKKPNPGMIVEACRDFLVEPADAAFIGDTLTDMQAAKSGGVQRRVLVQTGYGFGLMGEKSACIPAQVVEGTLLPSGHAMAGVTPFLYAANLEEAVKSLVGNSLEGVS